MVTRITNTMISNRLLSNLYLNLNKYDGLQNQLASGRKYAHISDNPSALIFGQAARNKLARLSHYQESVNSAQKWLTQTEAGVMELQGAVGNIYEQLINAGGARTIGDRQNIGMEVSQLRLHFLDNLNSSYGDRFVFAGYNTPGDFTVDMPKPLLKPFTFDSRGNLLFNGFNVSQFDKLPAAILDVSIYDASGRLKSQADLESEWDALLTNMRDGGNPPLPLYPGGIADVYSSFGVGFNDIVKMHGLKSDVLSFDVGPGINMPVTHNGLDVLFFTTQDEFGNPIMRNMYELLNEVHNAITAVMPGTGPGNFYPPGHEKEGQPIPAEPEFTVDQLSDLILRLKNAQEHLLVKTAEIGGRDRRLELLEARYEADYINYENMRSDAEDVDIAETIIYMKMAETVYQAALSAGARIIQPSLMDFLR